jgi:hypothetical protein
VSGERAIALQPELGEAWIAQGVYRYRVQRDYPGALQTYNEAQGSAAQRSALPKTLRGKAAVNLRDFGQQLIPTGEQSGLLMRIVMESVSLRMRMKS